MREFTLFKPGDKVKAVNDLKLWLQLKQNEKLTPDTEYTVISVTVNYEHAYEEECDKPTECLHDFTHPQLLTLDKTTQSSGFWFDPIIHERYKDKYGW